MPLNKPALLALNQTNFPDNTQQLITPVLLRDFNTQMIASMELTQSMSDYAVLNGGNSFIGSQSIDGYVSIDKTKALNTNAIYWNNNTVGYTNLEIINSASGNLDLSARNGKIRIITSSLDIVNGTFSASLENGYAWVGDGNNRTSLVPTSSFGSVTSAITASSLITASFSGNTLTFTKGDSSTFGVVIPDVSGSTIPAGTISGSSQITALGFVSSSVTGSSLITGSVSGNVLTFTKGDATQFSLTVATGSGGGGTIDTGSFATTGSNNFIGDQTITGSVNVSGGEHLFIKRSTAGANQLLRLGATDNENNFAFIVTGSDTNPGQQVWGINTMGGIWGNSFDAGVRFNSYITASEGLYVATGSGGGLSAPLQNGYVWVGNGSDRNTTAPTSSFGGSTNTGSLMTTGSVSGNVLTFTKGDSSTFTLTVETGSGGGGSIPTGTVSSSQQIRDYNIFAVTSGSNTFIGVQSFSGSAENANAVNLIGSTKMTLGGTTMPFNETAFFSMVAGDGGNNAGLLQYQVSNGGVRFLCGDAPSGSTQTVGYSPLTFDNETRSGSISFTNSGNTGDITFTNATGSINLTAKQGNVTIQSTLRIKQKDGGNTIQVSNSSGSLILAPGSFTTSSLHLSQSNAGSTINWVFKNNNSSGDTIISGSNNIFTNPGTPTTGYKRYIGGNNNLYLNGTNGITSQITASATTVSGVTPTMNNNIFNGINAFTINQAPNPGTHTYSHNIFSNGTITINALAFTGSLNLPQNYSNGTITINAASASVAEIATGISGSGTVTVGGNGSFGGTMTITSPRTLLTSNTQNVNNNILAGGGITITNISSSAQVNASNNIGGGSFTYLNAGAAGLGLHTTAGSMNSNYGAMTLIASASAINASNNISPAAMTVTNRVFSGSLGLGAMQFNNNGTQGALNTYTATGSFGGTISNITGPVMQANGIFGASNTIFTNVEGRGNYVDFRNNLIGGTFLILTGSNNLATTGSGGGYFGRFNANDGLRNGTAENILVIGTGTSAANRKTGFLIDSGSNTFVEGTLNVSGSSAFTGSVKIAPTFQLNLPTGSNQQAGTAVLDGANPGAVVVSNSLVTANSIIMLTKQTLTNSHMVAVSSKGAGTFTITSNGNGDTDTVGWFIINNS